MAFAGLALCRRRLLIPCTMCARTSRASAELAQTSPVDSMVELIGFVTAFAAGFVAGGWHVCACVVLAGIFQVWTWALHSAQTPSAYHIRIAAHVPMCAGAARTTFQSDHGLLVMHSGSGRQLVLHYRRREFGWTSADGLLSAGLVLPLAALPQDRSICAAPTDVPAHVVGAQSAVRRPSVGEGGLLSSGCSVPAVGLRRRKPWHSNERRAARNGTSARARSESKNRRDCVECRREGSS